MIPKEVLNQISLLHIEQVIGEVHPLRKNGAVYKSTCPFHKEKTPSFVVNPSKGIYKCFGCGKGGDVVSFFMEYESFSFPQSVKYLCEKYNITYVDDRTVESDAIQQEVDVVLKINRDTLDLFKSQMPGSNSFANAKERGILDATLTKFEVGHAPTGFKNLYNHLLKKYSVEDIIKSGVCKDKGDGLYHDVFRDRLVFPMHNIFGKIIGFSGRRNSESVKPKYINSPETRVFKKSKELYGLYFAKKHIIEQNEAIVVEGATDVVSLIQNGIENTVGTWGTAFTADHAITIKRFTDTIVLLYDGDNPGLKAVFSACEQLIKQGLMIYVCQLPEGQDPDSYVKEIGGEAMKEYIKSNKREWIEFRLSLISESVSDKIRLAKELNKMIDMHPDKIARDILRYDYSKRFGLEATAPNKGKKQVEVIPELSAEFHLLRVLLLYMNEWNMLKYFDADAIEMMRTNGFKEQRYSDLFFHLYDNPDTNITEMLHGETAESETAKEILNTKFKLTESDEYDVLISIYNYELYIIDNTEKVILDGEVTKSFRHKLNVIKKHRQEVNDKILKLIKQKNDVENNL